MESNNKLPQGLGKKIVDALKKDEFNIDDINEEKFQEQEPIFAETEQEEEQLYSSEVDTEYDKEEVNVGHDAPVSNSLFSGKNDYSQIEMEVPANIDVLKRLISQLPPGVSRQTGAQIIRQTIEAMGISMKSVLQEAQNMQEDLTASVQDYINTIEDYKNNIRILDKKIQQNKKQAAQFSELINLFILTDRRLK